MGVRAIRVIQWATGSVGTAAIKGVLDHPDLEEQLLGLAGYRQGRGDLRGHLPQVYLITSILA